LTYPQYGLLRHPTPYLIDFTRGGSRLVVFGVRHSTEPADAMFDQIEAQFSALSPSVVLHEGTPPRVEAEREIASRRHGEAGLLRYLAEQSRIESQSLDVPLAVEARYLREHLTLGETLVFLAVRQLASYNRKTLPPDFEAYFTDFFALIAPPLGLERLEWERIETAHRRILGHRLVREAVGAELTDPMRDDLPTQRFARLSNRWRDEHMLRCLDAATRMHPRVFGCLGVTHAVMLEPALRAPHDDHR
jgi:hypothetical protein